MFCFVSIKQNGQNLVPNPSFELNNNCLNGSLSNLLNWNLVCGGGGNSIYLSPCHGDPAFSTPFQYFDACFQSYQPVRTGVVYIDIGTYTQSSSQESSIPFVKLLDTLDVGKIYCVTYYVSMRNNARYSLDKLGALLTPTPFPKRDMSCNSTTTVPIAGLYAPQVVTTPGVVFEDTLNWMEVSGSFTAVGNEAYLAIGDFFLHAQHYIKDSYPTNCNGLAEYYVDDVSVEEVQIAKARNDTLIYAMDSVIIGNNASEAALFNWQPSTGLSCNNCPNPKASPSVTTTYTVTKTQCKATTTDVITVSVSATGINELSIIYGMQAHLFPNPNNGNFTLSYDLKQIPEVNIQIIDITGKVVYTNAIDNLNNLIQINTQDLHSGMYFIQLMNKNTLLWTDKVMISK